MLNEDDEDREPGVPGRDTDEDGRPYFFPRNRRRAADLSEQREGFTSRWEYRGHQHDAEGAVKSVCVSGEDALGRMRVVSTDGSSIHSWLELSDDDTVKTVDGVQNVTSITLVVGLDVLAASSGNALAIFDRKTLKHLTTLPTRNTAILHLTYNHPRDEIISGGSDGCHVWRLTSTTSALMPGTAPFQLTFLRGFKGCSGWTSKMILDEPSQLLIVINSTRLKTFEVATGNTRHCIDSAHEAPVTSGLWFCDSEHIVTGCLNGLVKIWACQHTDHQLLGRRRRSRRQSKRLRNGSRRRRRESQQTPAQIAQFRGHSGAVTGLVRHGMNSSLVISSSTDGFLQLWNIDRLVSVARVPVVRPVASLLAHRSPGGDPRLVCSGAGGTVSVMISHAVCEILGNTTQEMRRINYVGPLVHVTDQATGDDSAVADTPSAPGYLVEGMRIHKRAATGLLLLQVEQGLWGVMCESLLLSSGESVPPENPTVESTTRRRQSVTEQKLGFDAQHTEQETDVEEEERTLLSSWAPLSSVTEQYIHHGLAYRSRRVMCLSDSGWLHKYSFDERKGEKVRRVGCWHIEPPLKDESVTCMCLLPNVPDCLVSTLGRLVTHAQKVGGFDARGSDDHVMPSGSRVGCSGRERGRPWKDTTRSHAKGHHFDEGVVAFGTCLGGVLLVETIVGGTTLAYLEGVLAGRVTDLSFCYGQIDATTGVNVYPPSRSASAGRLVCAGLDIHGAVMVKGLALSSLLEAFSITLVEPPTCLCIAVGQPIVAVGYADGAINLTSFARDRICNIDTPALASEHNACIQTIAFSERYHCVATGSTDGRLNIWDLTGQLLHSIYLEDPARDVAFADVSSQIVLSQTCGMCRIPRSRWCPLHLLTAVEHAERRAGRRTRVPSSDSMVAREELPTTTAAPSASMQVPAVDSFDLMHSRDPIQQEGILGPGNSFSVDVMADKICEADDGRAKLGRQAAPSTMVDTGASGYERRIREQTRAEDEKVPKERMVLSTRGRDELLPPRGTVEEVALGHVCSVVGWRPKQNGMARRTPGPAREGFCILDHMTSKVLSMSPLPGVLHVKSGAREHLAGGIADNKKAAAKGGQATDPSKAFATTKGAQLEGSHYMNNVSLSTLPEKQAPKATLHKGSANRRTTNELEPPASPLPGPAMGVATIVLTTRGPTLPSPARESIMREEPNVPTSLRSSRSRHALTFETCRRALESHMVADAATMHLVVGGRRPVIDADEQEETKTRPNTALTSPHSADVGGDKGYTRTAPALARNYAMVQGDPAVATPCTETAVTVQWLAHEEACEPCNNLAFDSGNHTVDSSDNEFRNVHDVPTPDPPPPPQLPPVKDDRIVAVPSLSKGAELWSGSGCLPGDTRLCDQTSGPMVISSFAILRRRPEPNNSFVPMPETRTVGSTVVATPEITTAMVSAIATKDTREGALMHSRDRAGCNASSSPAAGHIFADDASSPVACLRACNLQSETRHTGGQRTTDAAPGGRTFFPVRPINRQGSPGKRGFHGSSRILGGRVRIAMVPQPRVLAREGSLLCAGEQGNGELEETKRQLSSRSPRNYDAL